MIRQQYVYKGVPLAKLPDFLIRLLIARGIRQGDKINAGCKAHPKVNDPLIKEAFALVMEVLNALTTELERRLQEIKNDR